MPTPLTHAVVGAGFATFLPPSRHRIKAGIALGVLAASPDLDVVGFVMGVPYSHAFGHRGISHSIPFAAAVALVTVVTVCAIRSPLRYNLGRLLLLTWVAVASHGILDTTTNGGLGVGLLMPFHSGRFFCGFRPIEVSAINPARFVETAAQVLWSEFIWVWLPAFVLLLIGQALRSQFVNANVNIPSA